MKKADVKVGQVYLAKVTNRVVEVRIEAASNGGGWTAVNLATGKRIRVKSAQRLRPKTASAAAGGGQRKKAAKGRSPAKSAPRAGKGPAKGNGGLSASNGAKKRLSALGAAAQVLAKAKEPMRCVDIVKEMAKQGLWTSPGGKTPEATLNAAIIREIKDKGRESRFVKAGQGLYAAAGGAS